MRPEGEATYSPLATPGYLIIPIGWLIITCSEEIELTIEDISQIWKREKSTEGMANQQNDSW